jgi:GDSL-like Lipase/Acylhydrolase
MRAMNKHILINFCLLLVSSIGALVVGYSIYSYIGKKSSQNIDQVEGGPYDYSFYNQKGRRLSELNGMLKLVTDPFTIYQNYPNQKSPNYSINKHGFREGYTSDNPYTAIVLGGSAAFGYALDSDIKTFASVLSLSNKKYNVLNSSVIGFLSGQELAQMIHYLDDFQPELYIVFDGWNDIAIPYELAKNWPLFNPLIGYNHAFWMIEDRLSEYFRMTRKEQSSPDISIAPIGELFDENRFFNEILKRYIANISKMHDFAHSRGAKFLLVFQPELGNKKSLSANEKEVLESWSSKFGYFDKKIPLRYKLLIGGAREAFQEKGIPFIDMNEEPEFSENPQTLFFDVVHPNELGHKIIANILNRALSLGIPALVKSRSTPLPSHPASDTNPAPHCTLSFADGWHAWEHDGSTWWRWTNGRGEIRGVTSEDSDMLLFGDISSSRGPNTVDVLVNGEKAATWQISWDLFKAFEPVTLHLKRGENRIVFISHNPAIRGPTDSRPLALAVSNLRTASVNGGAVCELQF